MYSLIWLPEALKKAGLKVALVEGWETRGALGAQGVRDVGTIYGVICHHTATPGPQRLNMPTLNTLKNGRKASADGKVKALPGPLAQLGLGRDGTYYVVAAGRCNHAGEGIWQGLTNGNANFIGIEAENTGGYDDYPWPAVQMEAYHRGVAAILQHIGRGVQYCAAHREYALPPGRKSDPVFDMKVFRAKVADIMASTAPPPVLIPATESVKNRPTLRRGANGPLVREIQRKIGLPSVDIDGSFGPKTEAALRQFQRNRDMVPDGIVGPKTWQAIDELTT